MQKRVALISFHTCPLSAQEGKETGGLNVYVLELAKGLSKKGVIVDVFTRDQDEKKPKIVSIQEYLRVIHIAAGPKKNISKKDLNVYIPEFVVNTEDFIKKHHLSYDILDCHYYLSGIAGIKLRTSLAVQIPLLITFHTLALMKNLVAKTEYEKESEQRIDAEMKLIEVADIVISTGDADAQYLRYLYNCKKEKLKVIIPGVDANIFKPIIKAVAKKYIGLHTDSRMILFVGRIEPLKGIDVLLYAMKILLRKNIGCTLCLWIVGGDTSQIYALWSSELKKLEKLRKLLDISAEVKFVGRKNPGELPFYYNSAEVVVMPSQYESFGMSALEAMACGVPVITTDATGISNFLDKEYETFVTSANNPLLLAERIEYLLCHEKESKLLGQNIMKKVTNLSWGKVAEKEMDIYQSLQSTL